MTSCPTSNLHCTASIPHQSASLSFFNRGINGRSDRKRRGSEAFRTRAGPNKMVSPFRVLMLCCLAAASLLVTDAFMPSSPIPQMRLASRKMTCAVVPSTTVLRLQAAKNLPVHNVFAGSAKVNSAVEALAAQEGAYAHDCSHEQKLQCINHPFYTGFRKRNSDDGDVP